MLTATLTDHLGDEWTLIVPAKYKHNRNGLVEMWVYVAKGPPQLAEHYQQIPLPVFTEWWDD